MARRGISTVGTTLLLLVSSCAETRTTATGGVVDGYDGGSDARVARSPEASSLPESGVFCRTRTGSVGYSVAYEVTNASDAGPQILDAVPRPFGELLVTRSDSIAVLSPTGAVTRSFPFVARVGHVTLSPAGDAYFTTGDGSVHVFDDSGQPLSTVSPVRKDGEYPESILRAAFTDSGHAVLVTFGLIDPDHERPTRWEIRALTGETFATLPATFGDARVPANGESLFAANGAALTRFSLPSGPATTLTTPDEVLDYRVSGDGTRLVLEVKPSLVVHVAGGEIVATRPLESAIWDLDMTPSGALSIATEAHAGRVSRFREGMFETTTALDLEWVNTAAVNERGEIVLGGQDTAHGSHVLFLDGNGQVAWQCDGPYDDLAFSPWARFAQDGNAVYAIFPDRLLYVRLVRA